MDDEYNTENKIEPPSVLVTTSRNPSQRLLQFFKEFALLVPNSVKINRGGTKLKELVNLCESKGLSDIVIINEHRGEPNGLVISHMPYGPTAYFNISNAILRHDLKDKMDTMSLAYPHLIFKDFESKIGKRVQRIIQNIFPIPKDESKRIFTFYNNGDSISFRHHNYDKSDYKTVELNEIGPRFDMKPFQILQGNLKQTEANIEWVLRPNMKTANKRNVLNN